MKSGEIMPYSEAKIRAQGVLLSTRGRATTVCLLTFFGKLIFSFSCLLCVYSLWALPQYARTAQNPWLLAGGYALFALGALLSVYFYVLTAFSQKRWFYQNAASPQPVRAWFRRIPFVLSVRLLYLFLLRKILIFFTLAGYLAPFLLGTGVLYYHLRGTGLSPLSFYAALGLLAFFLLGGAYYGFAAVQRYAFCDCLLCEKEKLGVVDALARSRKIAKDDALSVARVKLRFLLWFALCLLLLPALYVVPYYRQTVGCIEKTALDKNCLTQKKQKPIVLLHLVKASV